MPSVLRHCWLGGRKGIRPVKNSVVWCWRGYLSGAMCRLAYGPADATATHCGKSCFSKIQIGFTFLVPAHPCSPGQRAVKRVCVCVCVCVCVFLSFSVLNVLNQSFRVVGRSHRAGDATLMGAGPRLRRRSTARLEQSTRDVNEASWA